MVCDRCCGLQVRAFAYKHPKFKAIDRAIAKDGLKFVTLLRLSPLLPFAASNYLYGLTRYVCVCLCVCLCVCVCVCVCRCSAASHTHCLPCTRVLHALRAMLWRGLRHSSRICVCMSRSVDLGSYVLGSWVGMLPGTYAYVHAGALGRAVLDGGEGSVSIDNWQVGLRHTQTHTHTHGATAHLLTSWQSRVLPLQLCLCAHMHCVE